jgi:hypothetical protein
MTLLYVMQQSVTHRILPVNTDTLVGARFGKFFTFLGWPDYYERGVATPSLPPDGAAGVTLAAFDIALRANLIPRPTMAEAPLSKNRALEMLLGACGASTPFELSVSGPRGGLPERVILDRPIALIGRDRRCAIRLRAKGVAPRHAYLQRIAGRPFIVNLGGSKGSRGRDGNISGGWLRNGDAVGIGPYSISFARSAQSAEAPVAAWPEKLDPLVAGSVDQI